MFKTLFLIRAMMDIKESWIEIRADWQNKTKHLKNTIDDIEGMIIEPKLIVEGFTQLLE